MNIVNPVLVITWPQGCLADLPHSGASRPRVINQPAPTYPLTTWLMKPYSDCGNLSRKQRKFNYRVSRARVVIESAFGRLKGRWQPLLKRNDGAVEFLPTYVTACCVLHNICEQYNDSFNEDWLVMDHEAVTSEQTSVLAPITTSTSSGTRIHETLCNYFDSQ